MVHAACHRCTKLKQTDPHQVATKHQQHTQFATSAGIGSVGVAWAGGTLRQGGVHSARILHRLGVGPGSGWWWWCHAVA